MLRIVLVNNNEDITKRFKDVVAKLFIEKDISYKCYKFSKNDETLEKYISNKNENDIFIIIDNENINSVDIINKIRDKYHNIAPFIIVINFYNFERIKYLTSKRLYNTEIITKQEQCDEKLLQTLKEILCYFDNKKKCIMLKQNKMIYKIPYQDILYIEKEPNSKISNIHCKTEVLSFYISLNKLKTMLDNSFLQTHRSFIVNTNNISQINLEEGLIRFNNNEQKHLISRYYKKELKNITTKQGTKITN